MIFICVGLIDDVDVDVPAQSYIMNTLTITTNKLHQSLSGCGVLSTDG